MISCRIECVRWYKGMTSAYCLVVMALVRGWQGSNPNVQQRREEVVVLLQQDPHRPRQKEALRCP